MAFSQSYSCRLKGRTCSAHPTCFKKIASTLNPPSAVTARLLRRNCTFPFPKIALTFRYPPGRILFLLVWDQIGF